MAWFDPLNNSGGVSFDFFDFTYLSIPPINGGNGMKFVFWKMFAENSTLENPVDSQILFWKMFILKILLMDGEASAVGCCGFEVSPTHACHIFQQPPIMASE